MSWWAYCANADHEYWEGNFTSKHEAVEHAFETGLEGFWVAKIQNDERADAEEDAVQLLTKPEWTEL